MAKMIKSKKGTKQHCSVCGEQGHKLLFHKVLTHKKCTTCGYVFPISEMGTQRQYDRAKVETITNTCKSCRIKNMHARYSSSFRWKLTHLLCAARAKCRKLNIEFTITIDDLLGLLKTQNNMCWYSGQPLSYERGATGVSIERRDPSKGYTTNNIVLSSWRINNMKGNLTDKEFIDMCRLVASKETDHADINAARNIARKGTESLRKLKRSGSVSVLGVV